MAMGMTPAEREDARARARAAANFDEAAVPAYRLPELLVGASGEPVRRADQWPRRRAEILELFARCVYGRTPPSPARPAFAVVESGMALGGLARRTLVRVNLAAAGEAAWLEILVLTPASAVAPVPVFAALNHAGNHSLHPDPVLPISSHWRRDHPQAEPVRGGDAGRWPLEAILRRGYGVATMYNGDVAPDVDDGFRNGIHRLFYAPGQTRPADDEWGAIGAWAWGLSRIRDYLDQIEEVDARRVAVLGHSRLGKTALWAGAQDERFAMVISNDSGCGGAALSRRRFGETPGAAQRSLSALVLRRVPAMGRARARAAGGSAHAVGADRAAAALHRQRRRGSVGRPARRVPQRRRCRPGVPIAW